MQKFIDIHTHKPSQRTACFHLASLFPEDNVLESPFSIGIHPWHIEKHWEQQMQQVEGKAQSDACLAVGECGFDTTVVTTMDIQKEVFKEHILLAEKLCKPLVIHCVKAYDELLSFRDEITVPIIMHDFGKNAILGQQLQQKGIYLSIGKALFRESFAKEFTALDKSLLFFETDDMERSIDEVYHQAARLLGVELVTLQEQIQNNYKSVF